MTTEQLSPDVTLHTGDALAVLRSLPAESVNCCVTSPPYFGLRDYGTGTWEGGDAECDHKPPAAPRSARPASGLTGGKETVDAGTVFRSCCPKCGAVRIDQQIGLEETPAAYIANLVAVFREVRRVLTNDGVCWVNLGDSYNANTGAGFNGNARRPVSARETRVKQPERIPAKSLLGIPWMFAFAARDDGWLLRQDIIWAKPNPMPESVTDRCVKAHEYLFLLTKSSRYFWDHEANQEPATYAGKGRGGSTKRYEQNAAGMDNKGYDERTRRSVWTVKPEPYPDAHFATYPPALIRPCIAVSCPPGGVVLDPFAGSGTTLEEAVRQKRRAVGIELNPEYAGLIRDRMDTLYQRQPGTLFAHITEDTDT